MTHQVWTNNSEQGGVSSGDLEQFNCLCLCIVMFFHVLNNNLRKKRFIINRFIRTWVLSAWMHRLDDLRRLCYVTKHGWLSLKVIDCNWLSGQIWDVLFPVWTQVFKQSDHCSSAAYHYQVCHLLALERIVTFQKTGTVETCACKKVRLVNCWNTSLILNYFNSCFSPSSLISCG